MKMTIQLKERTDQTTGGKVTPAAVEIVDVLEINIDFQRRTMRVRFAEELGGARSESQWGEYSLDDVETYDWDDFSYRTVSNDALTQQKARVKQQAESELNQEITEQQRSGEVSESTERDRVQDAKRTLTPNKEDTFVKR